MNRRRVLSTIGGSAAMLSLAGCTGSDDTDDSSANGDDDSNDSTANGDDENDTSVDDTTNVDENSTDIDREALITSAAASLDDAIGEFETVTEDDPLEEQSGDSTEENEEEEEYPSVDTDRIETLVDEAEADIETAREGATDEQLATLDSLAAVAEFLGDLVPALSAINEAMTHFEEADGHMDNEEYDEAVVWIEDAQTAIANASDETTIAGSALDEIDPDGLESVDALAYDELSSSFEEFEELLVAMDIGLDGLGKMVEGMSPFFAGIDAFDAGQYRTAIAEFEAASDLFYRAYTTFDEGTADVARGDREDLLDLACETEAMSDAADLFAQASQAYANENYQRGQAYLQEANVAFERCEEEGGTEAGTAMPSLL